MFPGCPVISQFGGTLRMTRETVTCPSFQLLDPYYGCAVRIRVAGQHEMGMYGAGPGNQDSRACCSRLGGTILWPGGMDQITFRTSIARLRISASHRGLRRDGFLGLIAVKLDARGFILGPAYRGALLAGRARGTRVLGWCEYGEFECCGRVGDSGTTGVRPARDLVNGARIKDEPDPGGPAARRPPLRGRVDDDDVRPGARPEAVGVPDADVVREPAAEPTFQPVVIDVGVPAIGAAATTSAYRDRASRLSRGRRDRGLQIAVTLCDAV